MARSIEKEVEAMAEKFGIKRDEIEGFTITHTVTVTRKPTKLSTAVNSNTVTSDTSEGKDEHEWDNLEP